MDFFTTLYQFQGIPYAEPPIGALRFAKPKPIQQPRDGILDATNPGNSCFQNQCPFCPKPLKQSEDSLVLNIWTPTLPTDNTTNQSLKPVMFWIYGGALSFGTIDMYNGGPLAAHNVVFVAPNYRLGPFGFLYGDREDAPGNVGFYDQLLALKWVRENIHLFGGDKNQITIFGQSAGSWSVSAHILSPLSKGLFKRAIMQSGALLYNKDRDVISKAEAIADGKRLAQELGWSESMDWIQFLHIDLLAGITSTEGSLLSKVIIDTDKEVFTLNDFMAGVKASDDLFHDIDVQKVMDYYLKGVDTSSTPALKRAFYEYIGDLFMKYPTYLFAILLASRVRNRHNIYFYELSYQSPFFFKVFGGDDEDSIVAHGMDVPFVFGMPFMDEMVDGSDKTDGQFSRDVMRMWTNFAKYGKPDDKWPQLLSDPNVPKVKDLNPDPNRPLLTDPVDVKTTSGRVRGRVVVALNTTLYQFQGIPYAEPPIGALRFAKPKPIQRPRDNFPEVENQSEDSLVLNIWTPTLPTDNTTNQSLKPVMFWIYGGALSIGTIDLYNGGPLAAHDVVFVAPNYRLGYFGFLYGNREDAPGNVGFYDQLLALKWVNKNIHLFGGDKNRITIFGESAGSWSVSAHILSPLSKGLFKRAIMSSGAHMYNKDRDVISKAEAIAEGKRIAKELGCSEDMDWIQYLRTVDAKDLVQKTNPITYPVLGTEFLPISFQPAYETNNLNSDIDLMAGINSTEGSNLTKLFIAPDKGILNLNDFEAGIKASDDIYHNIDVQKVMDYYLKGVDTSSTPALKRAFYEFLGDLWMKYPTYVFARQMATTVGNRHNIYFYELSYQSQFYAKQFQCDDEESGVGHGMDIPFVFGMPLMPEMVDFFDEIDRQFSRDVMRMWTNFAKYGKPDDKWPQLLSDPNVPKVKDLNPDPNRPPLHDPYGQRYTDFWESYF
ncbi:unnamed protein product [Medioppia subpectinata]|uniref:Carboxylesterase type B domain-containing protein n=1 Tax=Medioppia subpectinata TaxID=1979941 RepID=A0A7R9KCL2_9ACAR|nr:unnamed protein product [Medioppia subpectinata]CAG2100640.1 unnamed protein product [Medioppia subpectinata]